MHSAQRRFLTLLLALLATLAPAHAQKGLTRLGKFRVSTDTVTNPDSPVIECDAVGNVIVAWAGFEGGANKVFVRRYNSAGTPLTDPIAISTTGGTKNPPSLSMKPDGTAAVVAWGVNDGPDIGFHFRRLDANGSPVGSDTNFASRPGPGQGSTDVAMADDGRFVVVWDDGSDVRARRYSPLGVSNGFEVPVATDSSFVEVDPSVAIGASGDFIVAWYTGATPDADTHRATFGRWNLADGSVLQAPRPVTDEAPRYETQPEITVAADGKFLITWRKGFVFPPPMFQWDIWAREFTAAGVPTIPPKPVYEGLDSQGDTSAVYLPDGRLVFFYENEASPDSLIARIYDAAITPNNFEELVVTSSATGPSIAPAVAVAVDAVGNVVFIWTETVGGQASVYVEKFFQPNQSPPLTEFRVNSSTTGDQLHAEVANTPDGRFVVVWRGSQVTAEGQNIYGQRYDEQARRVGAEFRVNSTVAGDQIDPSVAMDANGNFTVVWRDSARTDIYLQKYFADGTANGNETLVSETPAGGENYDAQIAMRPNGDFVVVWTNIVTLGSDHDVYARTFTGAGSALAIVDQDNLAIPGYPAVAVTPSGDFIVAWRRYFGVGNSRIFLQQYDLDGTAAVVGGVEQYPNLNATAEDDAPAIAVRSDGSFVVAWQRNGADVIAQRVNANRNDVPVDLSQFSVAGGVGTQDRVSAAFGAKGDMYFAYRDTDGLGDSVSLRRFRFDLANDPPTPVGTPSQINISTLGNQTPRIHHRSIAADAFGNYVIVWESENQDGSGYGIYATKVIAAAPDAAAAEPTPVSVAGGTLHVVFANEPVVGKARWRLAGAADWRTTDLGGLEPGNYLVEFEPVSGVAPDAQIAVVEAALPTTVTATYPATSGTAAPVTGAVSVEIKPDAVGQFPTVINRGQWRPVGTTTWLNSGDTATGLSVGAALIEFKSLPSTVNFDFVAPPSFAVNIAANETTRLVATYSKRTRVTGAQLPTVRTLAEVTGQGAAATGPWQFAGQIQSDSGSGSGVAIDKRVVLTAAHVLYDDAALSFVTGVRWLHQRVRDEFEPAAQFPRGFFLASGYSAGRAVELENGTEPGEETPESQERDYAAMYFVGVDCARGGASGYLKVDGPLDWLATAGQKTIIGYPVEAATDGGASIAEADFGKLFSTPPLDVTLTKPYVVATPTTRVYRTTAIAGVGGMSGGPVCAQFFDGRFYPVGIYLGGTGASFVRGIDQPVIDLIVLAASANAEDNNVGGGVTKTSNDLANSGAPIGAVKVNLEKPSGVLNTAVKWRLRGQKTERASGETALGLPARREPYVVEFLTTNRALVVPAPREIVISDTTLREITGIFTEIKKPEFAFSALPFAGVGLAYAFPLTIEGGKLTGSPTATVRIGATGGQLLSVLGLAIVPDAKTKRYLLTGTPTTIVGGEAELTFTAKNAGGTSTAKYFLTVVDPVTVSFNLLSDTLGEVSISPPVDGRSRFKQGDALPLALPVIPGQLYTLRAKAARGAVFAGWTGLSSEEGETLNIRFNTAGSLTANFGLNPFDTLAGNFGGLLQQDTFDSKTSGYVALKLGTTGSFTSAITLGGARYSMKGKLNGASEATVGTSRGKGKGTLTFSPRIVMDTDGVRLNGTLTATDGIAGSNPVRFTIAAPRQSYTKLDPAPMAGAWTLDLPSDPTGGSTYPKGHGYSAFTVDATGLVKGTIVLGDGTKTSTSGYFASDNIWRFYAAPYKNTGAFIGELAIASNGAAPTGTGTFDWQRPATAGTAFTGQTDAVASRWTPPATGIVGWHLTIGTTVPITATVGLSDKNLFTLTNLTGSTSIKLTLAPKTGLLSGDYLNATGKRIPFGGALLQQQVQGFGLSAIPGQTVPVTLAP